MIYELALAEKLQLEKQIELIMKQLKNYPEGTLICSRNENRYKWYRSDGKTHTHIPKKERDLAEQLAIKKYLTLKLEDITKEKRAIDFYLRHHRPENGKAEKLLNDPGMSEYQRLLSPYFKPLSKELYEWMNAPYEKNMRYPEHLTHKTSSGNMVRSKSEAMIAMVLHIHQIPFRYECALHLGESVIYPDFTIRHPTTGNTYYWEHFGLMDDPVYCKNACSKLQLYTSYGIIPTIQLITTYETHEHPLSSDTIESIISRLFI